MIGCLRGTLVGLSPATRKNLPSRTILLDVQGVGYEVQVTNKALTVCGEVGCEILLFTHLQVREDSLNLYGFLSLAERDIFRQLVGVSGIGCQMAMSLLDTLGMADLVRAIVTGNTRLLCMAQGVGTKTAERLSLELKSKLAEWRTPLPNNFLDSLPGDLPSDLQEDAELTLLALGYTSKEIQQALNSISIPPNQRHDLEAWIKGAIAWLSKS
jgi:Holliday junction DNA helicase RuvA